MRGDARYAIDGLFHKSKCLQVRYRIPSATGMGYGNFR